MSTALVRAALVLSLATIASACSPGQTSSGQAYTPTTGSAGGIVVPNARPGMSSAPMGASTAGSSLSR